MNEKKMARNALPWSSRPTLGPTASVRTIRYVPAPSPRASALSTAAAVASVLTSGPPAPAQPRAHYVLGGRAELLDLGVADPGGVEGAAELARAHGRGGLDLDERAARELDRVVEAVHEKQREAGHDDGVREPVGPAAPL